MNKLAVALCPVLLALPIGLFTELSEHVRPRAARVGSEAVPTGADGPGASVATASADATADAFVEALEVTLPYAERVSLGGGDAAIVARFEVALAPPDVLQAVTSAGDGARGALIVDVLQRRGALGERRLAEFGSDGTARGAGLAIVASSSAASVSPASSPDVSSPPGGSVREARWTPPVADVYVVQLRASPGSVGAFGFALNRRAPLDFPVATERGDSVRSVFGDARDGGRREHHGIDIFAPRGTDVLAAADGIVARVATSPRGGLHVWQRAEDDAGGDLGALYYAHLDSAAVLAGTRVARGDVVGTVGNSGNARTTPPHLHFGWYRRFRGPEDPLPLVGSARAAVLSADSGHTLGPWLAVAAPTLNLRSGPGTSFGITGRLGGGSLLEVLGVVGERWVRVRGHAEPANGSGVPTEASGAGDTTGPDRADGASRTLEGFVARSLIAPARAEPFVLDAPVDLLASPRPGAARLVTLEAGATLDGRGAFGRYRRVATAGGLDGWIDTAATDPEGEAALPDG